jgi:hypothetical protein
LAGSDARQRAQNATLPAVRDALFHVVWALSTLGFAVLLYRCLFRDFEDFKGQLNEYFTPPSLNCLRGMCWRNLDPHLPVCGFLVGVLGFAAFSHWLAGKLL